MPSGTLEESYFRREFGKLVALLSRRVGVQHLSAIEDAVQSALLAAIQSWAATGPPGNPSAWLYRVAHNNLISEWRKHARHARLLTHHADEVTVDDVLAPEHSLAGDIDDDLLRMLFVCCDCTIAPRSQLILALKVLCGFSTSEIALRLFTSEGNISKQLSRSRERLRSSAKRRAALSFRLAETGDHADPAKLTAVHRVLYLLFTEGYLSSHEQLSIRLELCDEAVRLATILAEHTLGAKPDTYALLSLMHLHMARMTARAKPCGGLVLLEDQDRRLWDQHRIAVGLQWLLRASSGERFSRYHAEAGIAAEHCLAQSFEETNWERIVECYLLAERIAPSSLHRLNRALALAQWKGPEAGLELLRDFAPPSWLERSYLWAAVMADLLRRTGDPEGNPYRDQALAAAPNAAIRETLKSRLNPYRTD